MYDKYICFWIFSIIILLMLCSCGDLLKAAEEKAGIESGDTELCITDFCLQQGNDNREILLTWVNPPDDTFDNVRLLRRTDRYPEDAEDENADLLYEGAGFRYRDAHLLNNTTYYYTIFTKSGFTYSKEGVYGSRKITETELDIRKRSFFLIGGSSSFSAPTTNLVAGVDMYDPVTETLTANIATLPNPRMFCAIASVENKIYIFGGKDNVGVSNLVDILDITDLTWTTGTPMTEARCALSAVPFNGRIYCLGGSNTTVTGGAQAGNYIYNILSDSWVLDTTVCANLLSVRSAFSACAFRGMLYYYGGVNAAGNYVNDGQYRNMTSNQSGTLGGLLYYLGCNPAFYYKDFPDGTEVAIFLTIGGSGDNTETALPAATMANLLSYYYVYAAFIPNITGGAPAGSRIMPPSAGGKGIEGFTNRAYGGCGYYGDYIYLFGGITGISPAPSTLIERLDVNDGNLYYGEWTSSDIDVLITARYAFGITRVNP